MADESFICARYRAIAERPYLASALSALIPVETKEKSDPAPPQIMSGDLRWRLYYDPKNLVNVEVVATAMIHIVTHLLRSHGERGKENSAMHDLWGIGGDEEINDDILKDETGERGEDPLRLPEGSITPAALGHPTGETVEQYYQRLLEDPPPSDDEKAGGVGDGFGGAGCGSCATGNPMEWEDSTEAPGISKIEGDAIRRTTAQQVKDLKTRGKVAAGWDRWADKVLAQPFDFKKMFQRVVRERMGYISGMADYTYSRPSRRQSIYGNVIMPSMVAPRITVGVIVDTSGSMSDTMVNQGLAVCRGCLEAASEIKVLSCDSAVHSCQTVFSPKEIKVYGGGGTDMRIPIRYFEKMRKNKPSIVLCVTDGYTPWPDTAPKGFQFITMLTSKHGTKPTFGDTYIWDQRPAQER